MTHLRFAHESRHISFVSAVSTRQLISGLLKVSCVNPHIIGYMLIFPLLFGAMTAAMSVGRMLPDIFVGFTIAFIIEYASGSRCAFSMKKDSDFDSA